MKRIDETATGCKTRGNGSSSKKQAADHQPQPKNPKVEIRILKERLRIATRLTEGITLAEFKLVMALLDEFCNYETFVKTGELVAWPGMALLIARTKVEEAGIKKARRLLRKKGVFRNVKGGRGPKDPMVVAFSNEWLAAREAEEKDKEDGKKGLLQSPLSHEPAEVRGDYSIQEGLPQSPVRGDCSHPDSYRKNPEIESTCTAEVIPINSGVGRQVGGVDEQFNRFWETYPRKIVRVRAAEAFKEAIRLTNLTTILLAVDQQALIWRTQGIESRYIPYPDRWLNERRWEEKPEIARPSLKNGLRRSQVAIAKLREEAEAEETADEQEAVS